MFNNKRIKELENRIINLEINGEKLNREIFDIKYPNGIAVRTYTDGRMWVSLNYEHNKYIKLIRIDEICKRFDSIIPNFTSEKLLNNRYFVSSADKKYNFIVDIISSSIIRVDKDMKVVL